MFLLQPFQVVPVFTLNPDAADPGVLAAFAARGRRRLNYITLKF